MAFADIIDWKVAKTGFGVEFDLCDGTDTVTAKVCTEPHFGPTYQPCLALSSDITQQLRFGDPTVDIKDFSWSIQNVRLQHVVGSEAHTSLAHLFAKGYTWHGQTVTIKLLALDTDGSILTSTKWTGKIVDGYWNDMEAHFDALATPYWHMGGVLPDETVTKTGHPDAPEASMGLPIPWVFGDFAYTYNASYNEAWNRIAEKCGLVGVADDAKHLIPCLCVERNEDDINNGPSLYVSDHALHTPPSGGTGVETVGTIYVQIPGHDQMAIPTPGCVGEINPAGGCIVTFENDVSLYMHFYPFEADDESTATDPENALDRDITTYATIDPTHSELRLDLKRPPDLGRILEAKVYALVAYDIGGAEVGRMGFGEEDSDDNWVQWWPSITGYTDWTGTSPLEWVEYSMGIGALLNFANDIPNFPQIRIQLRNGDDGYIRVYATCLVLRYSSDKTITYREIVSRHTTNYGEFGPVYAYWRRPKSTEKIDPYQFPDATATKAVFVACKGKADDGSGTYTGAADALIETPTDVVYSLLAAAGCNCNTSLVPGNIATARTDVAALSLKARMQINKQTGYDRLIPELCKQSLLGLTCRFSANMEMGTVFWGSAANDNLYGTAIHFDDVLDERETAIGFTPMADVRNAFYFQVDYSHRDGKCIRSVMCDGTTSDDGDGVDDYGSKAALAASEAAYGRRELHMSCPYMYTAFSEIRDRYAAMLCEPRVTLRFSVPYKYHDLQAGHVVPIDSDSWVAAGYYYPGGDGTWTGHNFWVERVSISPDGYIEVEASEGVWT